jgi:hypothetical protein
MRAEGRIAMREVKGMWKNGQVVLDGPVNWPDGSRLVVAEDLEAMSSAAEKIGIDEADWRDDPQALADWDEWLKTIEPLEWTAGERTAFARFDEEFRRFNLEAVRKQMDEGSTP